MFVIREGYSSVMHHVCEQSVSTKYFTRGEKSYIAHMCTFCFTFLYLEVAKTGFDQRSEEDNYVVPE